MYLVKTPAIVKPLSQQLLWKVAPAGNEVYLTFDDGPTPGVTGQVLDILDRYEAKATFFCIGGNVKRHPKIFNDIVARGHSTGNHTLNHMSGWEFSDFSYFRNVQECALLVPSKLFRPPYGRITRAQAKALGGRYTIVMWDVLSADWRADVSPEQCLRNVTDNVERGSIVVFHDSVKASANMLYALPRALEYCLSQGYTLKALPQVPQRAN